MFNAVLAKALCVCVQMFHAVLAKALCVCRCSMRWRDWCWRLSGRSSSGCSSSSRRATRSGWTTAAIAARSARRNGAADSPLAPPTLAGPADRLRRRRHDSAPQHLPGVWVPSGWSVRMRKQPAVICGAAPTSDSSGVSNNRRLSLILFGRQLITRRFDICGVDTRY